MPLQQTEDTWMASTDGSGYKEGMSVSAAIIWDPRSKSEKGLFCVKNEADAYRAELEAIILAFEFVAEQVIQQKKNIDRFAGRVATPRQKLVVFSDCDPAVSTVNNSFHQCSDTFEKYSMRLLCAKKYVDGKCFNVPRNVIKQQRQCDQIASGLRVAVKTFIEDQTDISVEFLRNATDRADAT